ncbi:hypothetical protein F4803DRAFT_542416, partial [Xylaria telfairii]
MSPLSAQQSAIAHMIILQNFPNIRSLVDALNANISLRHAFDSCPGIAEIAIRRQIDPKLLPLAIANIEASHKTYTHSDIQEVKNLYLDVFENPRRFTDRLQISNNTNPIPMNDLIRMGEIHDNIGRVMRRYMEHAWEVILKKKNRTDRGPFEMSSTEELRAYRAFYRLELFFKLCRGDRRPGPKFLHSRSCFFLLLHPPWELGQMACAYRCLERHYMEKSKLLCPSQTTWLEMDTL